MLFRRPITRHALLVILLFLPLSLPALELHTEDHISCSTCNAALEKSMGYLRTNFDKQVANDGWYAGMLNSFWGGFAFLIDGNSPKEAKVCADRMRHYLENWAAKNGGYEGWFASMAMFYMSEYCLRYGATPEIKASLEFGAKFAHKTREAEGGWFHGPRWGGPNYALDISGVGCAYFAAIRNMERLGFETGPALYDVNDYISKVCDGRSVAYGLHGRGGFALASASYVLIGLTSSGAGSDPKVAGIGGFLLSNVEKIRSGHANGNMHHFGVAAALHRTSPEAYAQFAGYYLHKYFIANMASDGSIAPFPNDNKDAPEVAYAELKKGGDYAATAILASMIMMTRPGAFSPYPPRKKGLPPNKDCFAQAQGFLEKGELADAHEQLSNILPGGGDDTLIPVAQEQRRALEDFLNNRMNTFRAQIDLPKPEDRETAEKQADICVTIMDQCDFLAKAAKGLQQADEAKSLERQALKNLRTLRGKYGLSLGKELSEKNKNLSKEGQSPFQSDPAFIKILSIGATVDPEKKL